MTSANFSHYTVDGHIVGMLDRDQRTAKCTCHDSATVFHEPERARLGVAASARIPADVTPPRSRKLRKSHYSWKNAQSKLNRDRRSDRVQQVANGSVLRFDVTHAWCMGIFREYGEISIRASARIPGTLIELQHDFLRWFIVRTPAARRFYRNVVNSLEWGIRGNSSQLLAIIVME